MSRPDLHELASAAALDPGRWPEVIQAVCDVTGAMGGAMFSPGVDPMGTHLGVITNGYGDMSGYKSYWAAQDPWLAAVAGRRFFDTAGEIRFGREFLPDAGVKKTAYYNDFGRHAGGGAGHKISLKVCDASDPFAPVTHFVVGRPFSSPEFDEADKERVARFWRPIQQAVRVHWNVTRHCLALQAPALALEALPVPTLILRDDATVEFANASARDLLRSGTVAQQGAGCLRRVGNLNLWDIKAMVSRCARGGSSVTAIATDGEKLRRLTLAVTPIRQGEAHAAAWPRAAVMLVILDGYAVSSEDPAWFRLLGKHFSLTPSEQRVLRQISDGKTVEDIAAEGDVSVKTVRTHLANLFDKTGRRRQGDLVRLVLGR